MIEIKNITKEFEKEIDKGKKIKFKADDNLSFTVKDGEILGLLGPNGAGKTTLLRMIAGIMKPTEGEVLIDKKSYDHNDIEVKKTISFLSGNTKLYKDISCGQTQRVGVARCVMHDPHNYILDEATSGLDIISSQVILDFIKEERDKGKCIIYSTHYMEEAENICDRVVLINKGKIIAIDTPEQIIKSTKTTNIRDAFFKLIGGNYNEME